MKTEFLFNDFKSLNNYLVFCSKSGLDMSLVKTSVHEKKDGSGYIYKVTILEEALDV